MKEGDTAGQLVTILQQQQNGIDDAAEESLPIQSTNLSKQT
jgi:hypothetical protein